jgi:hypothetical protein
VADRRADLKRAEDLLARIPKARTRLRQRLLLAAAITRVMERAPIVVGGTAEEYWAGGEYHPTDLDLCPRPSTRDIAAMRDLGLRRVGRHWLRDDLPVAVEFPGSGDDIERTVDVSVNGVVILMIGCEDLYLDRVRQSTVSWPHEDVSFDAALEVAITNYSRMDWLYVRDRIRKTETAEQKVGRAMAGVHRRVRSRARQANVGRAEIDPSRRPERASLRHAPSPRRASTSGRSARSDA